MKYIVMQSHSQISVSRSIYLIWWKRLVNQCHHHVTVVFRLPPGGMCSCDLFKSYKKTNNISEMVQYTVAMKV